MVRQMVSLTKSIFVIFLSVFTAISASAHVDTGGNADTRDHNRQVIGYITNWDAWKSTNAGLPEQGALNHLNIDYSKYTILNYAFFGVAEDGSLHSGDYRNKSIYQDLAIQAPADLFHTDIYSSWDMHLLFGEIEPVYYLSDTAVARCEAQGFIVTPGGSTWEHPVWGLSGGLPVPLHKDGGAPGLLELAHQKGVKVMASVGGWSMSKHFPEMAADPIKREKFISDCIRLINTGFDGIDIDWEYPGAFSGMNFTGSGDDYDNFLTLIKELRAALGSDKLITAAFAAPSEKLQGFDWGQLDRYMDYFNFMTYDFNGGWSDRAGFNSNIYEYTGAEIPEWSWENVLKTITALNLPKNKVCFGVPFYGRGVICETTADLNTATKKRSEFVQPDGPIATAADYTNWSKDIYYGTPTWFFIKQEALSSGSGWTRIWDDSAKVPYLLKDNYFLSYDDEESIGHKAQFVVDNDLAGVIAWTVFGDLEISGTATSYGAKLKRWSRVKSPLVNTINEVFAQKTSGSDDSNAGSADGSNGNGNDNNDSSDTDRSDTSTDTGNSNGNNDGGNDHIDNIGGNNTGDIENGDISEGADNSLNPGPSGESSGGCFINTTI